MYPSCDTVEYAMMRLMSNWAMPMVAARSAVIVPIHATVGRACSLTRKIGNMRAIRKTPAVTIVAAWMSALTGVGPSIASGSHTYSGNCALLPNAPTINSSAISWTLNGI